MVQRYIYEIFYGVHYTAYICGERNVTVSRKVAWYLFQCARQADLLSYSVR